jgi:hypothetical protein
LKRRRSSSKGPIEGRELLQDGMSATSAEITRPFDEFRKAMDNATNTNYRELKAESQRKDG